MPVHVLRLSADMHDRESRSIFPGQRGSKIDIGNPVSKLWSKLIHSKFPILSDRVFKNKKNTDVFPTKKVPIIH
jgi:hypothetical protein